MGMAWLFGTVLLAYCQGLSTSPLSHANSDVATLWLVGFLFVGSLLPLWIGFVVIRRNETDND